MVANEREAAGGLIRADAIMRIASGATRLLSIRSMAPESRFMVVKPGKDMEELPSGFSLSLAVAGKKTAGSEQGAQRLRIAPCGVRMAPVGG
ncbi:hypothetical protein LO772_00190 [Yinghuangia sp. ASG 101]|uniref:hypothetical protein n=1 Tax=Yinghuangia sp. ASG 101 TaxID=2896848 RepID=UPI001E533FC7|nr:hypothetical protein [Yinghuangia sp. ASG 101]UGQ12073.1 hypothetical protein LO772_00190 [Yinghuangia sp. ASG 101]